MFFMPSFNDNLSFYYYNVYISFKVYNICKFVNFNKKSIAIIIFFK